MYTPTAHNQILLIPRNYSQNNHRRSIRYSMQFPIYATKLIQLLKEIDITINWQE